MRTERSVNIGARSVLCLRHEAGGGPRCEARIGVPEVVRDGTAGHPALEQDRRLVVPKRVQPVRPRELNASSDERCLPHALVEVVPLDRVGLARGDHQLGRARWTVALAPRQRHLDRGVTAQLLGNRDRDHVRQRDPPLRDDVVPVAT